MNIHQKTVVYANTLKRSFIDLKTMKCLNIFTQMLKIFELTLISVNELDAKSMNWYLYSPRHSRRQTK